MAMQENMVL